MGQSDERLFLNLFLLKWIILHFSHIYKDLRFATQIPLILASFCLTPIRATPPSNPPEAQKWTQKRFWNGFCIRNAQRCGDAVERCKEVLVLSQSHQVQATPAWPTTSFPGAMVPTPTTSTSDGSDGPHRSSRTYGCAVGSCGRWTGGAVDQRSHHAPSLCTVL